jgi:hypothetical protein
LADAIPAFHPTADGTAPPREDNELSNTRKVVEALFAKLGTHDAPGIAALFADEVHWSGAHYLSARLALEHPSWPTIIDSILCSRPTLFAPEPGLLPQGSHSLPLTGNGYSTLLNGEFFGPQSCDILG